jgi:hypothetical protein
MQKSKFDVVDIDPSVVYFQHSKIKPVFSDGKEIDSTIDEIKKDINVLKKIPLIQIYVDLDGNYFSLNNRRLYAFKKLREEGYLSTVSMRVDRLPKHLADRYNVKNCSLNAKFMYKIKKDNNTENKSDEI